jgi:signal transduction histidine kinase
MVALEHEQVLAHERTRIAADLHDDVGANLTHIAQLSELASENAPPSFADLVEQIAQVARNTIKIMGEIVWTMNPRNDSLQHLIGYVGNYAAEFFSASAIRLHVDLPENPPAVNLSSDVRHHLFMVVKESLNNIAKHSGAKSVALHVATDNNMLRITIRDDGKGFTPNAAIGGTGLGNLYQRLQSCGGTVQITSETGQGTTIIVSLPLTEHR